MTLSPDVDLTSLGKSTPGYVGSDLYALCSEAGLEAIRRIVHKSTLELPSLLGSLCDHHRNVFQNILVPSNQQTQTGTTTTKTENENEIPLSALALLESQEREKCEDKDESSTMEREFIRSEEQMLIAEPGEQCDAMMAEQSPLPSLQSPCFYCSLGETSSIDSDAHRFISINMNDFAVAIKAVLPSAKREGFAVVPDVSWADVGALSEVCPSFQLTH
jgi:ribosome biogenesis ATPase